MATRLPGWVRQHLAAVRVLLVLTVLLGLAYPLVIAGIAQIPGLKSRADGSPVSNAAGATVGSALIGQAFTDKDGNPLPQYFQSRPSAAGDGYDPTATSASNLGPESIVDTLDDPSTRDVDESKPSLLSQVCSRSKAIGELEGVDGSRPFCAADGVGAVLSVVHAGAGYTGPVTRAVSLNQPCPTTPFIPRYQGVKVECHRYGDEAPTGQIVPVRGDAPANPAVPADAVTASGSGLDPQISPAYAELQVARVAKARNLTVGRIEQLVKDNTTGRTLGFLGEPGVNVLALNMALDRAAPV